MAQLLLTIGGKPLKLRIILQRAFLFVGRNILVAPQPVPGMSALLLRGTLPAALWRVPWKLWPGGLASLLRQQGKRSSQHHGQNEGRKPFRNVFCPPHCTLSHLFRDKFWEP